ncbi:glycine cleavage system protein GcvH [halophilic archaeon]|nr:glycine cleavage system protein GcvH [halophilic archaeon]
MKFKVPDGLQYTESHEWIEDRDGVVRIGITDFAQDELGDIVFLELPAEGDTVDEGDEIGVIESIKAVSDIYAPVSGEVIAINDEALDKPELVNNEPFQRGWMVEIETDDDLDCLYSPAEYRDQI